MKPAVKFRLMLAAALLAASLTGCVAVVAGAAGAGTVAWVRGELEATLDASCEKAATAANLAIKQLQFAKISEKKDALTAILIARTAEDKKVEIKVIKIGDQSAKVQIRVGVFGDEALSLTILDKIRTNL
jgi:ABC-type glycerol-3-phosphate transport system substrate-binding protein